MPLKYYTGPREAKSNWTNRLRFQAQFCESIKQMVRVERSSNGNFENVNKRCFAVDLSISLFLNCCASGIHRIKT